MTSYKDSGVDVEIGDLSSKLAYSAAKETFKGRTGKIGAAAILDGGFSGALDMGDFYLVQNDDGVGSKIMVAQAMNKWDSLGKDLLAMVADDAICTGAEVISLSNTLDAEKVDPEIVKELMNGLKTACLSQNIVIPGGEIAEMPSQIRGLVWNATSIGIVEKDKFLDGSKVKSGDAIIGLRSDGFRSNGFSLIRHVLLNEFGENWVNVEFENGVTWGEAVMIPSRIYHAELLELLGRFGEARKVDIHAIAHITGGGLKSNVARVVPNGLHAEFSDPWPAHKSMLRIMELGDISEEEAANTWNMGTAMVVILAQEDVAKVIAHFGEGSAKIIGKIASAVVF